jgi:hypothetical protein
MADLAGEQADRTRVLRAPRGGDAKKLLALYDDSFTCWTAGSLPFSGTHPRSEVGAMVEGVAAVFPTVGSSR